MNCKDSILMLYFRIVDTRKIAPFFLQFTVLICSLQNNGFINFKIRVLLWYKILNLPLMKKLIFNLFFLLMSFYISAQEEAKLPEFPWKEIVELKITDSQALRKWHSNINIQLKGSYTEQDSIQISDIVKKLDLITETVSINLSSLDDSNYKIYFSHFNLENKISYSFAQEVFDFDKVVRGISALDMFIHKSKKGNSESLYDLLEVFIAKSLVRGYFFDHTGFNNHIIFRKDYYNLGGNFRLKQKNLKNYNKELKIIEEVYKKGFDKKLDQATIFYKEYAEETLERKSKLNRERSLWWVKNPYAIIVLPVILLACFFLYLLFKIKPLIYKTSKKQWTRLVILILISLVFVNFLIIISVSTYDYLTIPKLSENNRFIRNDTILTTFIFSLFSIPFILIFRYIELKIQEKSNAIVSKITLIFISTGFLPSLLAFCIYLIKKQYDENTTHFLTWETYHFKTHQDYTLISKIFLVFMILAMLRTLISYFLLNEKEIIRENDLKLAYLKELKAKAELKSLQSQINPHFLYNSLNSIASLAPIDAVKTQKMAHSLSDLFKYSINRKGQKMSTIKDEIEMVEAYLEIEKIRFGDRLQFTIEADESVLDDEIPLFIIQPLVENAVKHGISKNKESGEITLKIEKEKNTIVIIVSDNGPHFPEGLVSGHGLQTVYDLLRLSYGDNAFVNWTNSPSKLIKITIPKTA